MDLRAVVGSSDSGSSCTPLLALESVKLERGISGGIDSATLDKGSRLGEAVESVLVVLES